MNQVHTTAAALPQHVTSVPVRMWHFVRHLLEMCVAMCVGIGVLGVVYTWAAGLFGIANPYVRFPELSALVLAFNMTAPMVAWMRFRRMAWRPIAEMSSAMVVEVFAILVLYWVGVLANEPIGSLSTLWPWQHGLMMPAMLAAMLFRLDVYTGSMHHQAHTA